MTQKPLQKLWFARHFFITWHHDFTNYTFIIAKKMTKTKPNSCPESYQALIKRCKKVAPNYSYLVMNRIEVDVNISVTSTPQQQGSGLAQVE